MSGLPSFLSIWWVLCAVLVFMMQLGFLLLESGFVRPRNMSGIAIKNFTMLLTSTLLYTLLGFDLMYGQDVFAGLIGANSAIDLPAWQFYQTGFAVIAATIVSGAIAERTTLISNIILAAIVAGIIYPLHGHWVWAEDGILASNGFHDFAGSGAVHFLGGMVALVMAYAAKPRLDKYDFVTGAIRHNVGPRSLPLASCGVVLLWIGWMGFNGGSIDNQAGLHNIGNYLLSTSLAASAGGFSAILLSFGLHLIVSPSHSMSVKQLFNRQGWYDPFDILIGTMAGMVAVTASCDLIGSNHTIALLIGAFGGMVGISISKLLSSQTFFPYLKIDDPVDAIAVHAGGGATGILSAALFPGVYLNIQALELLLASLLVVMIVYPLSRLLNFYSLLRVSRIDEQIGLNFEPNTVYTADFPLRTSYLSDDMKDDLQAFYRASIGGPLHRVRSVLGLVRRNQFVSPKDYKRIRSELNLLSQYFLRLADGNTISASTSLLTVIQSVHKRLVQLNPEYGKIINLPHPLEDLLYEVQIDPLLLEDILETLFSNALMSVMDRRFRYISSVGTNYIPKITCTVATRGVFTVISVEDNGMGVPESVVQRLFQPFDKSDWSHGFGLGLFHASYIARMFGGEITLDRNVRGSGATFSLVVFSELSKSHD